MNKNDLEETKRISKQSGINSGVSGASNAAMTSMYNMSNMTSGPRDVILEDQGQLYARSAANKGANKK